MSRKHWTRLIILLATAAVVVTGCQQSTSPTDVTPTSPSVTPTATPSLIPTPTPTTPGFPTGLPTPTPSATPALRSPTPSSSATQPLVGQGEITCPPSGYSAPGTASTAAMPADSQAPPSNETRLLVDGRTDDWVDRSVLLADALGDAEAGFPDLTTGYAFVNQNALYVLVELGNAGLPFDFSEPFESFEFRFQAGARELWVAWSPLWGRGPFSVVDITAGWEQIGETTYSSFAFDTALEARIDLRGLGSSESITLTEVGVRVGECCEFPEWRFADTWSPGASIPMVDEADPAWRLALKGGSREAERTLSAPDTRAITLDYDSTDDHVQVIGAAGAVPSGASLLVGNLELNDFTVLRADADGVFETEVVGAPGTHVLIKQDVTGEIFTDITTSGFENVIAPGVLLRIPVEEAGEGIAFGAGARLCCDIITWAIEGTFEDDSLAPGDWLPISGRVSLLTGASATPPPAHLEFAANLLGDADGRQVGRAGKFVTPFLTATGLPIERTMGGPPLGDIHLGGQRVTWELDGARWVADFDTRLHLPSDTPPGLYTLTAGGLRGLTDEGLEPAGTRPMVIVIRDSAASRATLGTFTVGNPAPMRLATTLLADEVSEGSHGGVLAREDQGLFDISGRALTRHDPIIPRLDGYGEAWSYRLEPYVPMIDVVDRSLPTSPAMVLDFSKSELAVTVARPDGETDVLGPAPLARYAVKSPRAPWASIGMGLGGGELREIPQLLGHGDTFAYQFPLDGDYVVGLAGYVCDVGGRGYEISGTYDLTIANVLDIETAMLPTTPFEVGDAIPVSLTVMPGVSAEVTYTVTHVVADGISTGETFTGRANAHGWWDGDGASWTFVRDGEYRIDVEARYTDTDGSLWAGRLRFGGVVATPNAPIIAHGRRGSDGLAELSRPWGLERDFEYDEDSTAPHMHFPYFTGDVLWGTERLHEERADSRNSGTAVVTHMSVQSMDDDHALLTRATAQFEQLAEEFPWMLKYPAATLLQAGQMPLFTLPDRERGSRGAHPDDVDLWSYTYSSAERPGVRVREVIQGDDVSGSYWRFGDAYYAQSGNGPEGDLPGDFKFMYGGAVIRDASSGEGVYAIYGSGWILLSDDDPMGSRIMPPYQGAAGGPSGGPLFTVHDREVDILFLPLGVRPGAVLETGDLFRMAGPIMPTLASRVAYTVTAPDGTVHAFDGRANAIGYFYDQDDDLVLDQPGVWTVSLSVTHDGQTSAGPVEPPYPRGGPLTPDGATFTFVVTDAQTHTLEIETDLAQLTPANRYFTGRTAHFEAALPTGWSGTTARVIVTMPGTVLIDEDVSASGGAIQWDLDAQALNRLASNFDSGWGGYR